MIQLSKGYYFTESLVISHQFKDFLTFVSLENSRTLQNPIAIIFKPEILEVINN